MADDEMPPPPEKYSLTPLGADGGEPKARSHEFSGMARAEYTNGDIYEGEFQSGKRHGKGSYKYYTQVGYDVFEGTFEDNMKTGLGLLTYAKGGFYNGYFVNNKREGEGTFKYPNGDIYSGSWKSGKRHGKGTYVSARTKYEMKGRWKDGQIEQGTWSFCNGTRYVGSFKNQKPFGDGVWQMANGTIVEGAYVQQVLPIDDKKGVKPDPTAPLVTEIRIFWKTATMLAAEA
mmetsp:Transcript_101267/g.285470  ORF Transcript_101267/g.285470 Transcript_101267/m.285470 type:complete len:231 (-) Transcript_101267:278-970(-)|eukprot:CAMPEP_0117507504 /NCGR_PEP_ID=MMETSP0784-20121206/26455_1 /TAXON_ID=39447 /ORGANISM="" /LENGTH=230 /DNA_ID=CAMNT_0005303005 /DNA_START=85 /DNA_END=777 /DNA_ORIENTATION=-